VAGGGSDIGTIPWQPGHPGSLAELGREATFIRPWPRTIRPFTLSAHFSPSLPKTKLGKKMIKKLKVYGGAEHQHQAQQPRELAL
jgi:large subunit ribosomal protein L13